MDSPYGALEQGDFAGGEVINPVTIFSLPSFTIGASTGEAFPRSPAWMDAFALLAAARPEPASSTAG